MYFSILLASGHSSSVKHLVSTASKFCSLTVKVCLRIFLLTHILSDQCQTIYSY